MNISASPNGIWFNQLLFLPNEAKTEKQIMTTKKIYDSVEIWNAEAIVFGTYVIALILINYVHD